MVGSGSRRDGANASEVVLHGKVFDSYASCKAFGLQRRDIKLIIIDVNKLYDGDTHFKLTMTIHMNSSEDPSNNLEAFHFVISRREPELSN